MSYPAGTTPVSDEFYKVDTGSKSVLVTRDPVFARKDVIEGRYLGREPHSYFPLAVIVTILNPFLGPIAIVFAIMSGRAYRDGDLKFAMKWSNYAFMCSTITFVASVIIYIAIGFTLSPIGIRGGHTP